MGEWDLTPNPEPIPHVSDEERGKASAKLRAWREANKHRMVNPAPKQDRAPREPGCDDETDEERRRRIVEATGDYLKSKGGRA